MRPTKKGTRRPPRPAATVPRTHAAAAIIAGREEHSPTTIAAHAAESTPDDDWVKRTPAAALIIPPPPQFADGGPPKMPPCQDTALPDHPSPCPDIPHLVVDCLPNWVGHFRTIGGALGHAPNAQAYGRGVIFSPKTAEEFQTVERCLIEAAAGDSAISWRRYSLDIKLLLKKQRRPNTVAAKTHAHRVDHARPLAEAAPREEPPADAPAATATPVATVIPAAPILDDATDTPDAHTPVATATPDAPTPAATDISDAPIPVATATPDAPIPVATDISDALTPDAAAKSAHHRERRRRRKRAPRPPRMESARQQTVPTICLDNMVQAILKIITTGMAAYLQEKGAVPVHKTETPHPRVHSQVIWRTRAGERPAQNQYRGNESSLRPARVMRQ